jgi:hypothetical protein
MLAWHERAALADGLYRQFRSWLAGLVDGLPCHPPP